MSLEDINLYASGSGGEIAVLADDVVLTNVLLQQIFLALFGGNVEASTTSAPFPVGAERLDYWQNTLLHGDSPAKQFNSETERVLNTTVLNSSGRIRILNAVIADLEYLKTVSNVDVNVVILGVHKVQIAVKLTQPQNQQDIVLQVIWDSAKQELIVQQTI